MTRYIIGIGIGAVIAAGVGYAVWRIEETAEEKALREARDASAKATADLNAAHVQLDAAKADALAASANRDSVVAELAALKLRAAEATKNAAEQAKDVAHAAEHAVMTATLGATGLPLTLSPSSAWDYISRGNQGDGGGVGPGGNYDLFGNRIAGR